MQLPTKITQAENLLAGVCQLCGEIRPTDYVDKDDYCKFDGHGVPWYNIPNQCQDKRNTFSYDLESMRFKETGPVDLIEYDVDD